MAKRNLDVVIISDVHLGTKACDAKALFNYLSQIEPKILVLNGDFVDSWQFSNAYFPKYHWEVIKLIMNFSESGIPVYYITGNHDDTIRRLTPFSVANIHLVNKLFLNLDGKLAWIFHGDIYDGSISHGRWIAKIAGRAYDSIVVFNRFINRLFKILNVAPTHFSKRIKSSVKKAVQKVTNFETKAIEIAKEKGYRYVICGHIHKPQIMDIETDSGVLTYLNSGDWLENLTSLEYNNGEWEIYQYDESDYNEKQGSSKLKNDFNNIRETVEDDSIIVNLANFK
jgi:UDP-2,3-diacylglucosamine pyrophosphatase LpxH